uniref:Pc21g00130 putative n=1 Tax=Albugo laibachii Nc14 TaxID=890382 RepID=F0WGQ4_9STRA|nr:Pc21g00130 putative [Albugo laibachii Nc14]|eukprot:CCA20418.1 Pc21g00130 putative [Albugo laibachii Nc14]
MDIFTEFFSKKHVVVEYLYRPWIIHKEKFVHAWKNQVQHFGNTSTSAAEGAHAALKRYLQTSTGNLDLVMTRMTQAVENQAREIEAIISKERIRAPHAFRNAHCFEQLIRRVSVFALRKLDVEREWSYECAEKLCSHSFRNVMAMPCAHELLQFGSRHIPLSMIDCHWYLGDTDAFFEEKLRTPV